MPCFGLEITRDRLVRKTMQSFQPHCSRMYASLRHLTFCFWVGALLLPGLVPCADGATPLRTLASFLDSNGAKPYAPLWQSADGNLYGTTLEGGANHQGAIFRTTPAGIVTLLVSFDRTHNGNFYVVTRGGGSHGAGTIFTLRLAAPPTTQFSLTNLYSFTGGSDGLSPQAELVRSLVDGSLYGTTAGGGSGLNGTVFRISQGGAFATVASFSQTNGATPYARLLRSQNGSFYGSTISGGSHNGGTLFNVSPGGN